MIVASKWKERLVGSVKSIGFAIDSVHLVAVFHLFLLLLPQMSVLE